LLFLLTRRLLGEAEGQSLVAVPKNNGVKVSIIEERDQRTIKA